MSRTRKKSEHYVNNKEFLEALIVYRSKVKAAQEAGEPLPRITNYLGECFLKHSLYTEAKSKQHKKQENHSHVLPTTLVNAS